MKLYQIKKLLHSKRNNQQSEDNGRKSARYLSGRGLISTIYKELKNCAYTKMFNILHLQGNANQNDTEILSHPIRMAIKNTKDTRW
jgi:hypothetical protein